MPDTYLFITEEDRHGETLEIAGPRFHHLVRVRRLRVGASLRAALPDGRVLTAEITEIGPDAFRAALTGALPASGVSPCRIILYQAVLKGEKMELVVQKASELGAHALVPLLAARSVPRWTPAQAAERADRWQRIADASAEQCERSLPLRVASPLSLAAALSDLPPVTLLLHERLGQPLAALAAAHPRLESVGVCIGPEGGWEPAESQALLTAGAHAIHLGERILRAETASLAALTLAQYLWGDLGGSLEG